MKSLYNRINQFFSYSTIDFIFLSDTDQKNTYILLFDKNIYSLFDENLNLLKPDIKIKDAPQNIRAFGFIKKTNDIYLLEIKEKNNPFCHINYSCSHYFNHRYNGIFLGLIKPYKGLSISTKFQNEEFVPVSLFNSHGPHLEEYCFQNMKGTSQIWVGDTDTLKPIKNKIPQYPWVLFFHGNDDMSLYARFKTYYDALTTWEIMKENDSMIEPLEVKKENLKDIFLKQNSQNLFYFFQN